MLHDALWQSAMAGEDCVPAEAGRLSEQLAQDGKSYGFTIYDMLDR
jgi:hypothetical protein